MASYSSSSSSSSASSIVSKEWSFRSTSSSSNNNPYYHNINTKNTLEGDEIIQSISPHHYYNCIATLKSPNHHHITCLAVHNNYLYAASGNEINVFYLPTLTLINDCTLSFDTPDLSSGGFIKSIAFDSTNNKILTAHQDSKIRVWKRHRLVTVLPTLRDKLCRFAWGNNYVQVRRHKRKLWIEHNDAVSGLALYDDLIYSVSWDKSLKIWRATDHKCIESLRAHDDAINAIKISVEGRVYTGSADGKINVWDRGNDKLRRHTIVDTLEKNGTAIAINAIALSRDGNVLLSGGCDGHIVVWEHDDEEDRMVENGVLEGHYGAILSLIRLDYNCYNENYMDLFASGSADRTVRIWGRGNGGLFGCLAVLEGHNKPVRSLAVVPPENGSDGVALLCSGSLDGDIKVWQVMVLELANSNLCHNFDET